MLFELVCFAPCAAEGKRLSFRSRGGAKCATTFSRITNCSYCCYRFVSGMRMFFGNEIAGNDFIGKTLEKRRHPCT